MLEVVRRVFVQFSFPVAFVAKIFIFAVIYWGIFAASPDSFRFGSGYNVTPLSEFWADFYETDDLENIQRQDFGDGLSEFQEKASELNGAYKVWQDILSLHEELEAHYEQVLTDIDDANEAAAAKYDEENVTPLRQRLERDERLLESLAPSEPDYLLVINRMARVRDELLQHYDFLISDREGFVPASLIAEEHRLFKEIRRHAENLTKAEGDFRQFRGELADAYSEAHAHAIAQIGFADFLYFSACVSTTTTFGDVTANKAWLRLLVVLQIVAGIVMLARMLEALASSSKPPLSK